MTRLTHNAEHDEGAAFSPDGTMIVYSGGSEDQHGDIKVMTAQGEYVKQLTDFEGRDESPDWQPIPAPRTTRECASPARSAGRDLRSRRLSCPNARRLVRSWMTGRLTPSRRLEVSVEDFGGTHRVILTR